MSGLVGQIVRWRYRDAQGKSTNPFADRGIVVAVHRRDQQGWELLVLCPNGQLLTWRHDDAEIVLPKADALTYEALEALEAQLVQLENQLADSQAVIRARIESEAVVQRAAAELAVERDEMRKERDEAHATIEKLSAELQALKKKHRPRGQQGPEGGAVDTRGGSTTPEK